MQILSLLISVFCTLIISVSCYGDGILNLDERISRFLEDNAHLQPYSHLLYSSGTSAPRKTSFRDEELSYMRKLMKYAPMGGTIFGKILSGENLPDTRQLEELSVASVLQEVKHKPEMAQQIEIAIESLRTLDKISRSDSEVYGNNSCEADYGAFVKPITLGVLKLVCSLICNLPFVCDICQNFPELESPDWGGRMIDAMAKIPEGIGEGNLHWTGAYEYCNEYQVTYNTSEQIEHSFNGQYCRLDLTPANTTIALQFGVCVPDTCSPDNVKQFIEEDLLLRLVLNFVLNMNITDVYCGRQLDTASDTRFQAALGIIVGLVVLVILATIWDGCSFFRKRWIRGELQKLPRQIAQSGQDPPRNGNFHLQSQLSNAPLVESSEEVEKGLKLSAAERLEMAFTGFSYYSNLGRIFRTEQKEDFIPVLDGIRVMSYGFLLLGQTYLLGPLYNECWVSSNLLSAAMRLPKEASFQPVLNSMLSSDSYFLISGTLITYWWLIKFETRVVNIKDVIYYVVHRYWRLMPTLMLSLMLYTTMYKYLGDGPLYPPQVADAENCRENWWPNLLMVNNFVNTDKLCFTWMWYPAVIFQLHVVSLLVLIPLSSKRRWVGYVMILALYVTHLGAAGGVLSDGYGDFGSFYKDYLITPWGRAGPFVIGLALGVILHHHRSNPIKMDTLVHLAGWAAALALIFGAVFVTYDKFKDEGSEWSKDADIAYDLLSRNAWGLGLAWLVLACHTGHGGVINSLLSYRFWWPLSKLVYVTLQTHAMIVFALSYGRYTTLYISTYQQMYRVVGHFWITMGVGVLLAGIFHYPLSIGLERAILATNKLQWIKAGNHYVEEVEEYEKELRESKRNSYGFKQEERIKSGLSGTGYVTCVDKPTKAKAFNAYDEIQQPVFCGTEANDYENMSRF